MKAVPARRPARAASLWMRLRIALFVALGAFFTILSLFPPAIVHAGNVRPALIAVTAGPRFSAEEMDLGSAAAFGGRIGLGITERMSVWLDGATSSPERRTSGIAAHVTAIRAMVQGRILTGVLRPYLVLGGGALVFNYGDAYDGVGAILTVGGGVDWRIAERTLLFTESTADIYGTTNTIRSPTGAELYSSPGDTQAATALSVGIVVEF